MFIANPSRRRFAMAGSLMLGMTVLTLLKSAGVHRERLFRLCFLGAGERSTDVTFKTLVDSIREFQPEIMSRLQFEYVFVPVAAGAIDDAVQRAMADKPDLLVAMNGMHAAAARRHSGTTPVVFSSYEDPIQYGFASDMRARREPICGVSLADALEGKRFEILRQAYPGTHNVAVLADRSWADLMGGRARVEQEAARQDLHAEILLAEDVSQVRILFADPQAERFDAWYIPATHLTETADPLIFEQMRHWKKPSIWASTEEVMSGAQMAYSQETQFTWQSIAELIARVLAGEPAGSIPIIRPEHFTLAIRVSPEFGVPLPDISVIRRADIVLR